MRPTCPTCGSVAVERKDKTKAFCTNVHCRDNGRVRRINEFRDDPIPVDMNGREAQFSGGYRKLAMRYDDVA